MDIDSLIDLATYNNVTQNFHRFYERPGSVAKVVRRLYVVKELQEGILSETATLTLMISSVLQPF